MAPREEHRGLHAYGAFVCARDTAEKYLTYHLGRECKILLNQVLIFFLFLQEK